MPARDVDTLAERVKPRDGHKEAVCSVGPTFEHSVPRDAALPVASAVEFPRPVGLEEPIDSRHHNIHSLEPRLFPIAEPAFGLVEIEAGHKGFRRVDAVRGEGHHRVHLRFGEPPKPRADVAGDEPRILILTERRLA